MWILVQSPPNPDCPQGKVGQVVYSQFWFLCCRFPATLLCDITVGSSPNNPSPDMARFIAEQKMNEAEPPILLKFLLRSNTCHFQLYCVGQGVGEEETSLYLLGPFSWSSNKIDTRHHKEKVAKFNYVYTYGNTIYMRETPYTREVQTQKGKVRSIWHFEQRRR